MREVSVNALDTGPRRQLPHSSLSEEGRSKDELTVCQLETAGSSKKRSPVRTGRRTEGAELSTEQVRARTEWEERSPVRTGRRT